MYVHHTCLESTEVRRRHEIPWILYYCARLWAKVLGMEPHPFARTTSVLNLHLPSTPSTTTPNFCFKLDFLSSLFVMRQGLTMYPWLAQNLLWDSGWPRINRDPLVSSSQELGLKAYTPMPDCFLNNYFKMLCVGVHVCIEVRGPFVRAGSFYHMSLRSYTQVLSLVTSTSTCWPILPVHIIFNPSVQ